MRHVWLLFALFLSLHFSFAEDAPNEQVVAASVTDSYQNGLFPKEAEDPVVRVRVSPKPENQSVVTQKTEKMDELVDENEPVQTFPDYIVYAVAVFLIGATIIFFRISRIQKCASSLNFFTFWRKPNGMRTRKVMAVKQQFSKQKVEICVLSNSNTSDMFGDLMEKHNSQKCSSDAFVCDGRKRHFSRTIGHRVDHFVPSETVKQMQKVSAPVLPELVLTPLLEEGGCLDKSDFLDVVDSGVQTPQFVLDSSDFEGLGEVESMGWFEKSYEAQEDRDVEDKSDVCKNSLVIHKPSSYNCSPRVTNFHETPLKTTLFKESRSLTQNASLEAQNSNSAPIKTQRAMHNRTLAYFANRQTSQRKLSRRLVRRNMSKTQKSMDLDFNEISEAKKRLPEYFSREDLSEFQLKLGILQYRFLKESGL